MELINLTAPFNRAHIFTERIPLKSDRTAYTGMVYHYRHGSMETTYLSRELGGASDENLIPELYDLAKENTNFSHTDGVGGFHATSGASWTIGAMTAHTGGVPLKVPDGIQDWQNGYGQDGEFLDKLTNPAIISFI